MPAPHSSTGCLQSIVPVDGMAYINAYLPSGISVSGSPQLMLQPAPAGTSCTSSTTCLIRRKSGRPKAPNPLDDPSIPLKRAQRIMANRASADRSKQRAKIARAQTRQRQTELKSQLTDIQQQLQATQDCMDVLTLVECVVVGVPVPAVIATSLKRQLHHGGVVPMKPVRRRPRLSTRPSPPVMLQPQCQQQHVEHFAHKQAHLQPEVPSGLQHPWQPAAHDTAVCPHPLPAPAVTPAAGAVPQNCSALNKQEAVPNNQQSQTEIRGVDVLPLAQTSTAANTAGTAQGTSLPATCTQELQQALPALVSLLQVLQQCAERAP